MTVLEENHLFHAKPPQTDLLKQVVYGNVFFKLLRWTVWNQDFKRNHYFLLTEVEIWDDKKCVSAIGPCT